MVRLLKYSAMRVLHPEDTTPAVPDRQPGAIFRSLHHRNFRLFFIGQSISLIGTWAQMVAAGWLAYELTTGQPPSVRAFWLGFVAFIGRIPTFILAPLAGVLVDRWNRHYVVMISQALAMTQASTLALLTMTHWITLPTLIILSLILGVINAVDVPARQSFMVEMLDTPDDLHNAIALNSSLVNGARIIGPGIAGVLLNLSGAGFCFLVNAISFVPVLAALHSMSVKPAARPRTTGRLLTSMAEGMRYAFGFAPVRDVLVLLTAVSLSGTSYTILLPIFSEQVLHQGSGLYAALFAMAGVGALAGAVMLAARRAARGVEQWIAVAPLVFGAGLIALGVSRWAWLSLAVMPIVGFGMLVQLASSNTLIQTVVNDQMRGRVMSLYTMAFMGTVPFGGLLAGVMARWVGAPATVVIMGLVCIVGGLVFAARLPLLRGLIHPIYTRQKTQPIGATIPVPVSRDP